MQIDRRFTNGLAWAGVFIVVGVPLADIVSAQLLTPPAERVAAVSAPAMPPAPVPRPANERPAAPAVAATKPATQPVVATPAAEPERVDVAAVEPAKPAVQPKPASSSSDPVASFVEAGKPLPSYISDGGSSAPAAVAATPAATQPSPAPAKPAAAVENDPITVAAVPQKPVPFPMPLSMRPAPQTAPTFGVPPTVTAATPNVGAPPLVIPDVAAPAPQVEITAADLEDWESGPLSEFLARRQQQGNSRAYVEPAPGRDRDVAPVGDFYFFPFGD